ncbi:MAG TPA: hypothetical protein VGK93_03805 [Candidatus Eisenbacteria bacterium]
MSSITLDLDRHFLVLGDPRPGKDPRWYKSIRTSVVLTVVAAGGQTHVTGFANFFLVRGDSAMVPPQLQERGLPRDSSRWYLERWEDETCGSFDGLRALPTKYTTWGMLKALYR